MSAKSKLEKLEKASIGEDQELIIAHECLDDRGKYEIKDHEDLGLLSLEEIEKRFQEAVIIHITYVDNWRGDP